MSTLESTIAQSTDDATPFPGEILARAREAKGFTQEYVAGKLYLRVRVIECIEQNLFDQMPQAVFVQGYIRAYAKLIGLAPEPLIEGYSSLKTPERKVERILRQKQKESGYRDSKTLWMVAASGLLVLVLGYYWWSSHGQYLTKTTTSRIEQPMSKPESLIHKDDLSQPITTLVDLSSMETKSPLKIERPKVVEHDD
jgi:cytoskeleton protein RodZ